MKIFFESLGCDKNLVDSEMMVAALQKAGHQLTDDLPSAEVIVVNTCCFIGDAKEESINTLLSMAEYKEMAKCRLLVAAGCLAQRYHKEIRTEIPEVDVIVGTTGYEGLAAAIEKGLAQKGAPGMEGTGFVQGAAEYLKDVDYLPEPLAERNSLTGGYYAYLKIAEGCDKHCSYCVIPGVRGKYRSVPMEKLEAQAAHLVKNGAKELILVAQETTLYGVDLYGAKSLPKLLEKLSAIEGLMWLRILYCYPEEITQELMDAMKRLPKVCRYLDIPIQHSSDRILQRMGRRTRREEISCILQKLRAEIPGIALRTTLITGFPGETEKDFENLKDFVREQRFERLGVFAYSQEEDTPAASFGGQVDEEVKEARRDEIMELQQEIAFEKCQEQIGKVFSVMVEGRLPEENLPEGEMYIARTYMDAPEVDGYVFVRSKWNLMSGDFITVKVIGADGYDLIGEISDGEEE